MNIVFMGVPNFAVPVLQALLETQHNVVAVYSAPDRRRGRGLALSSPPIVDFARARDLPIRQPASLRGSAAIDEFRRLQADVGVVAAYGRLIPPDMLALPRRGFLNIHPSLLPRYRGPSPVVSAILDGVAETGVSVMLLDEGMDTGPTLAQQATTIGADETAAALTQRLFELGARLLIDALPAYMEGRLQPTPQDAALATVTRKIVAEYGDVDWREPAEMIRRRFLAYTPWPGIRAYWNKRALKLLDVGVSETAVDALPGTVSLNAGGDILVATGEGALIVRSLQPEGRRDMPAKAFLAGHPEIVRARLGR